MAEKSSLMLLQETLELKKENTALKETVTKLLVEVERLRNSVVPISNSKTTKASTEEQIINDQIELYNAKSLTGSLSLDDIRGLDLLIKNKRMLLENKPLEPDYTDLTKNKSEEELLQLAGNSENKKFRRRDKSKTGTKDPVE